jgi:hypothetical protein
LLSSNQFKRGCYGFSIILFLAIALYFAHAKQAFLVSCGTCLVFGMLWLWPIGFFATKNIERRMREDDDTIADVQVMDLESASATSISSGEGIINPVDFINRSIKLADLSSNDSTERFEPKSLIQMLAAATFNQGKVNLP